MKRSGTFITGLLVGVVLSLAGSVYATSGERSIAVLYNDVKIRINGKVVSLTDEPFGYNGRTYVPLRFIAEALGQKVGWDQATKTVLIGEQPPIVTPEPTAVDYNSASSVSIAFLRAIDQHDVAAWNDLCQPGFCLVGTEQDSYLVEKFGALQGIFSKHGSPTFDVLQEEVTALGPTRVTVKVSAGSQQFMCAVVVSSFKKDSVMPRDGYFTGGASIK